MGRRGTRGCEGEVVPEGGLGAGMNIDKENKVYRDKDGSVRDYLHNCLTPKYFMKLT